MILRLQRVTMKLLIPGTNTLQGIHFKGSYNWKLFLWFIVTILKICHKKPAILPKMHEWGTKIRKNCT